MSAGGELQTRDRENADFPYEFAALSQALMMQRKYTLAVYADLPEHLWQPAQVPYLRTINPPLWELAHIAWFAEFFALRWRADDIVGAKTPSILATADTLFNSQAVAHQTRWNLDYPDRAACFSYMQASLDALVDALANAAMLDERLRYGCQLALAHEAMHAEALVMTLRSLRLAKPTVVPVMDEAVGDEGDLIFAGGRHLAGANTRAFRFDNEMPPFQLDLAPFAISCRVVTTAEFDTFLRSTDYHDDRLWSSAGIEWRSTQNHRVETFSGDALPAMHLSYHQAEAWCRWAGRRLPTEHEWEFAATQSDRFGATTGNVWEWTASAFAPYPGFAAGPYLDYSEPWFYTHQVLKGGSFVTSERLKYPQYRNFYEPSRSDVFCGFRTCALA